MHSEQWLAIFKPWRGPFDYKIKAHIWLIRYIRRQCLKPLGGSFGTENPSISFFGFLGLKLYACVASSSSSLSETI